MDVWDDSQPDGPEPEPWKKQPQPPRQDVTPSGQPHGYFEPSKYSLLDSDALRRQKHYHRLLADSMTPHPLWWKRLMAFLGRGV